MMLCFTIGIAGYHATVLTAQDTTFIAEKSEL